jgi:hypothetical protein
MSVCFIHVTRVVAMWLCRALSVITLKAIFQIPVCGMVIILNSLGSKLFQPRYQMVQITF